MLKNTFGGRALDRYLIDFEPDGDGDGGDGSGGSGDDAGAGGQGDGGSGDRTFSQAEVDRIVQERVARVKNTPPADYDDLKTKAAEFDKIEAANKSELEKERERAAKLERDAAAATELVQRTRVESAIVAEAAKRGADTDIAVSAIDRSSIEFDNDGNPTNVADVVESLLKAKPFLVTGGSRGNADQGARNGGVDQIGREQLKTMSSDEILKAQKEGRLDGVLGRR